MVKDALTQRLALGLIGSMVLGVPGIHSRSFEGAAFQTLCSNGMRQNGGGGMINDFLGVLRSFW